MPVTNVFHIVQAYAKDVPLLGFLALVAVSAQETDQPILRQSAKTKNVQVEFTQFSSLPLLKSVDTCTHGPSRANLVW